MALRFKLLQSVSDMKEQVRVQTFIAEPAIEALE
jgi:hypothetical protein